MSPVDAGFPDNAKAASDRQANATIYRTRPRARQRVAAGAGCRARPDAARRERGTSDRSAVEGQVRQGADRGDALAQTN